MAPTILVIGVNGNTGKSVVRHLPKPLQSSNTSYRILSLTRSLDNRVSQKLAALSWVKMQERDSTRGSRPQSLLRCKGTPVGQAKSDIRNSWIKMGLLRIHIEKTVYEVILGDPLLLMFFLDPLRQKAR